MRDLPDGAVHCAVVKADGYGHGAVPAARAALEAGSTWLGVATAPEAEELRAAGFTAPILIFGPLTGTGLERAAERRRRGRRLVGGVHRRGRPPRRPRARQVRHRHGPARRAGARGPRPVRAGARRRRALRPDEPLRDGGRGRHELLRAAAGAVRQAGRGAQGAVPRPALPHGQQRGDAARPARPLRHGADGDRDVRPRAGQRRPLQGRPAAGDEVRLVRRRRPRGRPRRVGRVRPHVVRDRAHAHRDRPGRLRRRRAPRAQQSRRGARRRAALPHRRPHQHGPDDGAGCRTTGARPGDEVVLFGAAGDGVAGGSTVAWTSPDGPRLDAPETPRILCEEMARMLGTINYEVACDVAPRVARRYRGEAPAV